MTPERTTFAEIDRNSDNAHAKEARQLNSKAYWAAQHRQEAEDIRRSIVVLMAAFGGMFVAGGMLFLSELLLAGTVVCWATAGTAACWAVAGWLFRRARRCIREK